MEVINWSFTAIEHLPCTSQFITHIKSYVLRFSGMHGCKLVINPACILNCAPLMAHLIYLFLERSFRCLCLLTNPLTTYYRQAAPHISPTASYQTLSTL